MESKWLYCCGSVAVSRIFSKHRTASSCITHLAFFSMYYFKVQAVQQYNSIDTTKTWKNPVLCYQREQIVIWQVTYQLQFMYFLCVSWQAAQLMRYSYRGMRSRLLISKSSYLMRRRQHFHQSISTSFYLISHRDQYLLLSCFKLCDRGSTSEIIKPKESNIYVQWTLFPKISQQKITLIKLKYG